MTILLAEDNRVSAQFMCKVLERLGHQVVLAEDGQQALDLLELQAFDCVLMDIQMPVLGGDAATAVIRSRELQSGAHLPIVALTAHALDDERERLLNQGFDAHIAKPVDVELLLATIQRLTGC